ncbi:hypothetical protein KY332_03155 [Candidatus Woesearchaeota archaeon]|nr:hypothetical protein [Candidatus Woesearchaeota archaeon]
MKTKSQMEIMGLAIIVILVALAMLFAIQFIILKPAETKETLTQEQLAFNTLNAILATNTNCNGLPLSHLIEDCAEGAGIQCIDGDSCYFAAKEIEKILALSLEEWKRQYYFTIEFNDLNLVDPIGEPCPGAKASSQPCCSLPTRRNIPILVNLDICS